MQPFKSFSQDKEYKYFTIIAPYDENNKLNDVIIRHKEKLQKKFGKKVFVNTIITNKFSDLQKENLSFNDAVIIIGFGNPHYIANIHGLNTQNKNLKLNLKPGSHLVLSSSYTGSMEPKEAFEGSYLDGVGKKPSQGLQKNIAYALAKDNPEVEVIAPCGHVSGVRYVAHNEQNNHQRFGVRFYSNKILIKTIIDYKEQYIQNNKNYIKLICEDPKTLACNIKIRDTQDAEKHKWTVFISQNEHYFNADRPYK